MRYSDLELAISHLDDLLNGRQWVCEAYSIPVLDNRCRRLLDMGNAALAGRCPQKITRITSDQEVRELIEKVEIWPTKTALLQLHDAGQAVLEILIRLVEQPNSINNALSVTCWPHEKAPVSCETGAFNWCRRDESNTRPSHYE